MNLASNQAKIAWLGMLVSDRAAYLRNLHKHHLHQEVPFEWKGKEEKYAQYDFADLPDSLRSIAEVSVIVPEGRPILSAKQYGEYIESQLG